MTRHCLGRTRRCSGKIGMRLMQIGLEVIPVFGNDQWGWSLSSDDAHGQTPGRLRYQTLDELFFVLVNMNVSHEGTA